VVERTERRCNSISLVIPCYNEAGNLDALLGRCIATLTTLGLVWEIVLVDDGSRDNTALQLAHWSAREPRVRALLLSRNFGKEAALSAGIDAARGQTVVLMDADLQHEPELIPTMLQRWEHGIDVVYARRRDRSDEPWFKRTFTRLFYRMLNATHPRVTIPPDAGDFRLLDRHVVDALKSLPEHNRFMKGMYAWVGFRSEELPYTPQARASGQSHYNLHNLVSLSLSGMTAFTTWPLRASSVLGVNLALLAFGYGGYLVIDYWLFGTEVSGWTTIVVSTMLFSGVQLLSLGVLGEYIARIYEEVKGRPLYIVHRHLGTGLPQDGGITPATPPETPRAD
jgi:glycosyltransferase involved in cell wall biosynthesis